MNINGDIILIEDDEDDQEILTELFNEVLLINNYTNKIVILSNGESALKYLSECKEEPFMVISDINMPGMNGFTLREHIFNNPKTKDMCLPYIFLTTVKEDPAYVAKAYYLSVQGYFTKPNKYDDFRKLIDSLIHYWKLATTP